MKYLGGVYCGKQTDCAIFENYRVGKRQEYAAFMCVCGGMEHADAEETLGRYAVRRLQEWVRRRMTVGTKINCERLFVMLEKEVRSIWHEINRGACKEVNYLTGGIWLGREGMIFSFGKVYVCQINKLFAKGHVRLLVESDIKASYVKLVEMQDRVGVLFVPEETYRLLDAEMLRECLGDDEAESETWVRRRIKELGRFAQESLGYITRREE